MALLQLLLKISNHIALVIPDRNQLLDNKQVYSDAEIEKLCFPDPRDLGDIRDGGWDYFFGTKASGKMAVLEKLLQHFQKNKDKVLIFSYSVKVKDARLR